MKRAIFIVLVIMLNLPMLFSNGQTDNEQTTPKIMVSVPPQEFILEQITKDLIEVNSLLEPQDNAHSFNPSPSKINQLSQSQLYFPVGIALEGAFMDDVANTLEDLRIYDFHESIHLIEMTAHQHHDEDHHDEDHHDEDHHDEDHHDEDHHDHGNLDPHVWLGIEQVEQWLNSVVPILVDTYPQYKDEFEENLQAFLLELHGLEDEIAAGISPGESQLFAAHPAFGYFCHTFGVEQLAVEIEGKEPSPRQLEEIIEEALEDKMEILVVQPQFSQQAARTIAEAIEGEVVIINPLSYDWYETMEQLSQAVQRRH